MAEAATLEARRAGMPGRRGRNVLVTGGNSGIGQAIAGRFAECPYRVNHAEQMLQMIETLGSLEESSIAPQRHELLLSAFRGWRG